MNSFKANSEEPARRLEDKIKLEKLEMQTQYELKYLSNAFEDLKVYVKDSLSREVDRFNSLDRKVNMIILAVIAQMAGVDLTAVIALFRGIAL
jgi:hypothetical protein